MDSVEERPLVREEQNVLQRVVLALYRHRNGVDVMQIEGDRVSFHSQNTSSSPRQRLSGRTAKQYRG